MSIMSIDESPVIKGPDPRDGGLFATQPQVGMLIPRDLLSFVYKAAQRMGE